MMAIEYRLLGADDAATKVKCGRPVYGISV